MLIAGIGIPGCGKSTLIRLLAEKLDCQCWLEPEEDAWPILIQEREWFGYFNCIHAFRGLRIPGLLSAHKTASMGRVALVDSYYDKLCAHWLGRPGTEWLIRPDDPYFHNFLQTAWLDYRFLPDADVVVVFEILEEDWKRMVDLRARRLDAESRLSEMFHMQRYFDLAAEAYATDRQGKTKLVRFRNRFDCPEVLMEALHDELMASGAIG